MASEWLYHLVWLGDTYFYSPAPEDMKARAKQWGELAVAHGVPLPALAIAFGLWPKAVSHVVCGMRTAAEVRQNIAVRHAAHLPCRARRSVKVTGLAKKLAFIGICSQNLGPT